MEISVLPTDRKHPNTDYDYYVDAILFGATIGCYAVLFSLFLYLLWRLMKSFGSFCQSRCCCFKKGDEESCTLPYKNMEAGENTSHTKVQVAPIVSPVNFSVQVEADSLKETFRNPFRGPLHFPKTPT